VRSRPVTTPLKRKIIGVYIAEKQEKGLQRFTLHSTHNTHGAIGWVFIIDCSLLAFCLQTPTNFLPFAENL
jgi:hypothetical protein